MDARTWKGTTHQQQILRLWQRFPRAKIVLAHIGRAYYLKNVLGNLALSRG